MIRFEYSKLLGTDSAKFAKLALWLTGAGRTISEDLIIAVSTFT